MDDNTAPTCAPLRWLRGDLHNHCERPELIEEYLSGLPDRLDFIALTNHAQKPVFFTQHEMVERARDLLPGFPIFFGLEWNAPEGKHACVIFPPAPDEAERAYAFSRSFDRHVEGSDPRIGPALAFLGELPADQRPILFFNHPSPGHWPAAIIERYLAADTEGVVAGIEALNGHQAFAHIAAWDPLTYPGAAADGLADHVYRQKRSFALLAHSDFHVHKQEHTPDYTLGVFNHVRVGVAAGANDAAAIFAALRAGRTCAVQGDWLDLLDCAVGQARLGDCAKVGGETELRFAFAAGEEVRAVDVIGSFDRGGGTAVLHCFGPQAAGRTELSLAIPPQARGYIRLRFVSASEKRPGPEAPGPKAFLTSAIFLD